MQQWSICGAGGLIFGWNALTQMLKEQGNYTNGCDLPQNRATLAISPLSTCLVYMSVTKL